MPQPERFDVLVLGSGTGGKLTASHMARLGHCGPGAAVDRRVMSEHRLFAEQK